jgi:hypothetical protein
MTEIKPSDFTLEQWADIMAAQRRLAFLFEAKEAELHWRAVENKWIPPDSAVATYDSQGKLFAWRIPQLEPVFAGCIDGAELGRGTVYLLYDLDGNRLT